MTTNQKSLKKWINFPFFQTSLILFNLSSVGNFFWVKSERTVSRLRKWKRNFLCCAHLLHKVGTWNKEVSCRSHATTARKCTKQHDAHAKLFAVAISKTPYCHVVIQKFYYHGNVASHFSSLLSNKIACCCPLPSGKNPDRLWKKIDPFGFSQRNAP